MVFGNCVCAQLRVFRAFEPRNVLLSKRRRQIQMNFFIARVGLSSFLKVFNSRFVSVLLVLCYSQPNFVGLGARARNRASHCEYEAKRSCLPHDFPRKRTNSKSLDTAKHISVSLNRWSSRSSVSCTNGTCVRVVTLLQQSVDGLGEQPLLVAQLQVHCCSFRTSGSPWRWSGPAHRCRRSIARCSGCIARR